MPPYARAVAWALPVYFIVGPVGGMLIGLARGLSRWWLGRRFLGILGSFPGAVFAYHVLFDVPFGSRKLWALSVLFAVVWGGTMSFIPERDFLRARSQP
jgi:hypothetical protein